MIRFSPRVDSSRDSWILLAMISFGTCTSALAAVSNGLVGVLTTFRVPDKDSKGPWSVPSPSLSWIFPFSLSWEDEIINSWPILMERRWRHTLTSVMMFRLNVSVYSLGWVIHPTPVRSVTWGEQHLSDVYGGPKEVNIGSSVAFLVSVEHRFVLSTHG